jgi:hypothetical protein
VVYGLYVISPVNQLLPPSPAQCVSIVANLARAWARQDHTTSPSADVPLVNRHIPVHRIPPHVRDDRDTPLGSVRNEGAYTPNQKFGKQEYFCAQGLTRMRGPLPGGQIGAKARPALLWQLNALSP